LSDINALPTRQEIEELILLEAELGKRQRQAAIKYYQPNPIQEQFHKSDKLIRAFFGGNRSGKTTAGTCELVLHTTGDYPDWYPQDQRYFRPIRARVFATDFKKGVNEVITPCLERWFPQGSIKAKSKNNQGSYDKYWVNHASGGVSVFDIMTYEQDNKVAEGWSGDFLWFDEPPPREHWIASKRGLIDYNGRAIFTLTPLREPWLFDEIYESKDPNVACFIADIRDNVSRKNKLTGQLEGLDPNAITNFEKSLTDEEKEVRLHGKFRHLAGLIYKEWDRSVHTKPRTIWKDGYPPSSWPRMMIIDPHDRLPFAIAWMAMDQTGDMYGYREAWLKEKTIIDVVRHIRDTERHCGESIRVRLMDPNFGAKRYANTGATVQEEFESAGKELGYPLRFTLACDDAVAGRYKVHQYLQYDKSKPISLTNHPKLYLIDDLKEWIYQMEHYIWDEYKFSDRDAKEKPKDTATHFPDVTRYGLLHRLSYDIPTVNKPVNMYGT